MSETGLSQFAVPQTDLAKVSEGLGGGDFLAYIKLCGSTSNEVKEGKVNMGCWGLKRGEDAKDLGSEIVPVVIAARYTAMDFESEDGMEVTHDPKSEQAARIRAKADLPGMTNAVYGPEFLMYIEGEGFLLYHCGSKSARRAATSLVGLCTQDKQFVPTPIVFETELVKHTPKGGKKEYSFHVPKFKKYDGEIPEASFTAEEYKDVVDKFQNPVQVTPDAGEIEDDKG